MPVSYNKTLWFTTTRSEHEGGMFFVREGYTAQRIGFGLKRTNMERYWEYYFSTNPDHFGFSVGPRNKFRTDTERYYIC